jgi:hypothetical protein
LIEPGRPREQVENHGKAFTPQVTFLCKAELGFFQVLEIVTCWLVPPGGWYLPPQNILLPENRFLRQVRELNIQRKNPGSALWHQKQGLKRLVIYVK